MGVAACRRWLADGEGAGGFVELPEAEAEADQDNAPDGDEDGDLPPAGEVVPETQDVRAEVDAQRGGSGVAQKAAEGEGDEEFLARHLERSGGEDEG